MNNIVIDFRHNYVRGERLPSVEIVYQYDEGRVAEVYVPETEATFFLHVGFENDAVFSVIDIDSVSADAEDGGYMILATIPDSILARYGTMLIYVVAVENSKIVTTYEGQVAVRPKALAEDYVVPDEEATSIIERAAASAAAAEAAAAQAILPAEIISRSETAMASAEDAAEAAQGYAESIGDVLTAIYFGADGKCYTNI